MLEWDGGFISFHYVINKLIINKWKREGKKVVGKELEFQARTRSHGEIFSLRILENQWKVFFGGKTGSNFYLEKILSKCDRGIISIMSPGS